MILTTSSKKTISSLLFVDKESLSTTLFKDLYMNIPSIETLSLLPDPHTLRQRRQKIQAALGTDVCAIIPAGAPSARNFPANHYVGFRASSHFLYVVGQHLPYAVLILTRAESILFNVEPSKSGALWHGEEKSFSQLSQELGCQVNPLRQLTETLAQFKNTLRPPSIQAETRLKLIEWTGRDFDQKLDHVLIEAIVNARLIHDEEAIQQLRYASKLTYLSHIEGIKASRMAKWAHEVRAAMQHPLTERGATVAYAPIVTPNGEVLHNHDYHSPLTSGDLLLVDVGAETPQGWAGDVTRTWPVNGIWSPTQKAIYDVVLTALEETTALARPGIEYSALHQKSRQILTEGLIDVGILKGSIEENLDANSIALFFPHGVGHLLGLDVHDMEDLGDAAGYAQGRERRSTFGWGYLRLDRPLFEGMAITVEPGFYQVPALLKEPSWAGAKAGNCVDWSRLEHFEDVRGIRIEDDLLITQSGVENLTAQIPTKPHVIQEVWHRG
jgi:Xaa-Pro aminopeptidase